MKSISVVLLSLFFLLLVACEHRRLINEGQNHVNYNIEEKNAELHEVNVEMAAGELNIMSGEEGLFNGNFNYPLESWKPEFDYEKNGGVITTSITQKMKWNMEDVDGNNEWDLLFDSKVPLILKLNIGAGECDVDLAGTNIKSFEINTGAGESSIDLSNTNVSEVNLKAGVGEVRLDLSGNWSNDNRTVVNGGIGQLTVYVPENIGVRARVSGLLGEVNHNLRKDGSYYVNELYGSSDYTMELIISAGIGEVSIREK
ncbi:MAG: toast rack family protein [Cyclobacteriaceae bacterium]